MSTHEAEINARIGGRLGDEISRLSLKQEPVAEQVGTDPKTLRNWIAGKSAPRATQLGKLAELGVDIWYVLTGTRMPVCPGGALRPANCAEQAAVAIQTLDLTREDSEMLVAIANRLAMK